MLANLYHYPYGCLEQTTSVAFPLLFTNDVAEIWSLENKYAKSDPKEVQKAIGRILERQRSRWAVRPVDQLQFAGELALGLCHGFPDPSARPGL